MTLPGMAQQGPHSETRPRLGSECKHLITWAIGPSRVQPDSVTWVQPSVGPPRAEEGIGVWCIVVQVVWFVYHKHHVRAQGCPRLHLAPGCPGLEVNDRLCCCVI